MQQPTEALSVGAPDLYGETIKSVRNMITVAIGCLKELKAQAVEKYKQPGMRILIGEILSCLGQAQVATGINPKSFNVTRL